MSSPYDLARQLAAQLVAQAANDAHGSVPEAKEFLFDVVLGSQAYTLTFRRSRASVAGSGLSPREREVVRLVAKGLPNKAIAQVLEISLWTVGTHLRRVFAKLGVTTRAQMIARILEEGLLAPIVPPTFETERLDARVEGVR